MCAVLYGEPNFGGWVHKVSETDREKIPSKFVNAKSIKIKEGCTFHGYEKNASLLKEFTGGLENLYSWFANLPSFSCKCAPSKSFVPV